MQVSHGSFSPVCLSHSHFKPPRNLLDRRWFHKEGTQNEIVLFCPWFISKKKCRGTKELDTWGSSNMQWGVSFILPLPLALSCSHHASVFVHFYPHWSSSVTVLLISPSLPLEHAQTMRTDLVTYPAMCHLMVFRPW